MSKIGKIWTDSVAYVALLAGAGLSIAGNIADTYRTRQGSVDTLDLALAIAWPALVILMVEIFVSARWQGLGRAMQWLRWAGCISIGLMAMRVSWVHLNDLMASRGQKADVAVFGPLAIDCLAIMATALILAGRGQTVLDPADLRAELSGYVAEVASDIGRLQAQVQDLTERQARPVATEADVRESEDVMNNPMKYLGGQSVADEAQHYLDRLSGELAGETTPAVPVETVPVSPAPQGNRVRAESVPDEVRDWIQAWSAAMGSAEYADVPTAGDVDALVAGAQGVSTRTARRWRYAVLTGQARAAI